MELIDPKSRKRGAKKSREIQDEIIKEVMKRDEGCVFCKLHYRDEDHVPIAEYDYHIRRGKMFACCEYHAYFLNPAHIQLLPQRQEMLAVLDNYLSDKEDPEPIW